MGRSHGEIATNDGWIGHDIQFSFVVLCDKDIIYFFVAILFELVHKPVFSFVDSLQNICLDHSVGDNWIFRIFISHSYDDQFSILLSDSPFNFFQLEESMSP